MNQVEPSQAEGLNPWLGLWYKPHKTFHWLLAGPQGNGWVIPLAMLATTAQALDRMILKSAGDTLSTPILLGIAVGIGLVFGPIGLYLHAWLLWLSGLLLKGQASRASLRKVLAWAQVPVLVDLALILLTLPWLGEFFFTSREITPDGLNGWITIGLGLWIGLTSLVLGVWSWLLTIFGIAAAQGFSSWRALGNWLLASAIVAVPIIIVVLVAAIIVTGPEALEALRQRIGM